MSLAIGAASGLAYYFTTTLLFPVFGGTVLAFLAASVVGLLAAGLTMFVTFLLPYRLIDGQWIWE